MGKEKIIITGHTGFVGLNLTKFLTKFNKSLIGVSRNPINSDIGYTELDKTLLDSTRAIVHLAGKAHDLQKTSKPSEYFKANTELTKKIFNSFLESKCEVFIYLSSVKAATDRVKHILTEDATPNPITAYGESKLKAEKYILSKEIPMDKRVYILRPCMIHGPNNKGNLNLLYSLVSKGIPYLFGKFENQRSFLSVDNLCFVINELIENPTIQSGIYNIADDEPLSTVDLIKIIGNSLDKEVKLLNISPYLIKKIAKIGDYLPIFFNSEKLQKLTVSYVVSNKKIKKAIKKELPLSAIEGLEQTFKYYDKNL